MRNVKCVIGATVSTPILLAIFIAVLVGIQWVFDTLPIITVIMGIIIFLFLTLLIWFGVYGFCTSHYKKTQ